METAITAQAPVPKERAWGRPLRDIILAKSVASADQMLAWASVRTSLTVFATGWILVHVASFFVTLLREGINRQGPGATGLLFLQLLAYLALGTGLVLYVTGMCMSVAAPGEADLKGRARGIVACLCASLLAFLVFFQQPRAAAEDYRKIMLGLFAGAAFLAKLLYTRFLRGLAQHFELPRVAAAAEAYFCCEVLFFLWALVLLIQGPGQAAQAAPLELLRQDWLALLASGALCVWFAGMILTVRTAMTQTLTGGPREREAPPGEAERASTPPALSQESTPADHP
jgi:hypothetical protein